MCNSNNLPLILILLLCGSSNNGDAAAQSAFSPGCQSCQNSGMLPSPLNSGRAAQQQSNAINEILPILLLLMSSGMFGGTPTPVPPCPCNDECGCGGARNGRQRSDDCRGNCNCNCGRGGCPNNNYCYPRNSTF